MRSAEQIGSDGPVETSGCCSSAQPNDVAPPTATSSCCDGGDAAASAAPASAKAIDPVCGMSVDPATSQHRFDHAGTTYYFCCAGCRTKFAADPDGILAKAAKPFVLPAKPAAKTASTHQLRGAVRMLRRQPRSRRASPRSQPRHAGCRRRQGARSGLRHDRRSGDHASIASTIRARPIISAPPAAAPSSPPIPSPISTRPRPSRAPAVPEGTIYTCPMHPADPPGRPGQLPDLRHGAGARTGRRRRRRRIPNWPT